ncbi:MAG: Fe-S-containing hydro-lyase [Clostridiales bacterium]
MSKIILTPPLKTEDLVDLKIGDTVYITGTIYTARDAAHKRLVDLIDKNEKLPFDIQGQIIYYAGPAPNKPGKPIGSIGPTTSYRMDAYAPRLIAEKGLKGMIGKGKRNDEVKAAIRDCGAVYFGATGGAAALLSQCVKSAEVIAYPELGPEAIRRLEVEEFPVTVINDIAGGDLYEEAIKQYNTEEK